MDFFNKIGSKISTGASAVVNKTKDIAGTTKINIQISEDEKEIENLYKQLGRMYFEKNGKSVSPEYKEIVEQIFHLNDRIDEAKLEIQRIKGITICENCGAELNAGTKFCSKCGTKVPEYVNTAEVVETKIKCPACGHEEEQDISFCSACGCKLK